MAQNLSRDRSQRHYDGGSGNVDSPEQQRSENFRILLITGDVPTSGIAAARYLQKPGMKRLAISIKEFRRMLLSSCPPTGWGNMIAVAHSGGADSTCLLYLLHRLASEQQNANDIPREILALSVDHSLQSGSVAVADHCRKFSESLQVPHAALSIPWGHSPFPDRPVGNRPYEGVARAARYRVLMEAMKASNVTVIAMGHHADDQVETLLMRLARDLSGNATPTGMRSCRRWGMGTKQDGLDWSGLAGMHRWIVRPLLGVSKERILATCEFHKLNYVDDPTNFQPSLTPRNYIRQRLSKDLHSDADNDAGNPRGDLPLVINLDNAIQRLNTVAETLPGSCKESSDAQKLYVAASYLAKFRDNNDKKVSQYLSDFARACPPSTLLLSLPPHASLPPPEIRRAIVLRILRFVSPRPWGSPFSEASRRASSLDLICDKLWGSPIGLNKTFAAGSDVVWRPVVFRDDGRIRLALHQQNSREFGWLASRQPPVKRSGCASPCVRDISDIIASKVTQELLWDNRFLFTLRPHRLSADILESCQSPGSVMIQPHGWWLLPKIVWQRPAHGQVILGGIGLQEKVQPAIPSLNWADIQFVRSLDAI